MSFEVLQMCCGGCDGVPRVWGPLCGVERVWEVCGGVASVS